MHSTHVLSHLCLFAHHLPFSVLAVNRSVRLVKQKLNKGPFQAVNFPQYNMSGYAMYFTLGYLENDGIIFMICGTKWQSSNREYY